MYKKKWLILACIWYKEKSNNIIVKQQIGKKKNAKGPFCQMIGPYSDASYNYVLKIII